MGVLKHLFPERILAAFLLEEIYSWENKYRKELKIKYPNINEKELREKILCAKAKKFRKHHDFILLTKLRRLKESKKEQEE